MNAKTSDGMRAQRKARERISSALACRRGEIYVLSDGAKVTSHTAFKIVTARGGSVSEAVVAKRLANGARSIDELMAAPKRQQSEAGLKSAQSRAIRNNNDAEFVAALNAVNARKTRGFK